jgi:uncharacterized membrane protein YdfJ with MMPL/SSD domain
VISSRHPGALVGARRGGGRRGPAFTERLSRRRRLAVIAVWAVAAAAGAAAWTELPARLGSSVEVPGSPSAKAADLVRQSFHEAIESSYFVSVSASSIRWHSPQFVASVRAAMDRAAHAARGRPSPLETVSPEVVYAELSSELPFSVAKRRASAIRHAIGRLPGARVTLGGYPIASHQLGVAIADDLRRAEIIAIPLTGLVLLLLFGSVAAVAVPVVFAATTISVTMGLVWIETHFFSIPLYAINLVTLVGIALAVDYSMLYVMRYREELRRDPRRRDRALDIAARTAGRTLLMSGATVAAGLAPLTLIPIPFLSGLGLAALAIPLVSVLASVTLIPVLIELPGRHLERGRLSRTGRRDGSEDTIAPIHSLSALVARRVLRRAGLVALGTSALLLVLVAPVSRLALTGGSSEILERAQQLQGVKAADPEAFSLAADEVIVDSGRTGAAWAPSVTDAERRLVSSLAADPEVSAVQAPVELANAAPSSHADAIRPHTAVRDGRATAKRLGLVDEREQVVRIRVFTVNQSGSAPSAGLIQRLRSRYIPDARFDSSRVLVGGAPAADYDFVHQIETSAPLLVAEIAAILYVLLALALQSVLLPLKAIAMNALSVSATCGVLVVVFQFGWGQTVGLAHVAQIDAWVPVMLFGALFGISTDYELFMVTRIKEEWRRCGDNEQAVIEGLRLVGRVVGASALVMIAIFTGFMASKVVPLQQFGVGLVAGVALDATVVRMLLVPSLMKLLGKWNWYVPELSR